MANHTITISSDKGAYLVAVVPPCSTVSPRLFEHYRQARGWAAGLRLTQGWAIQDETGGDHG